MPTPSKGPRLGGSPAHERIILRNLAAQLFEHGRITTTETKAKRLRPFAEKLITKAKRGDLHSVRLVVARIGNKDAVHTLFHEIAPQMADRNGGYTRITKVGPRKGDNAPMAVIEIVTESVEEGRKNREKVAKQAAKAEEKAPAKTKKAAKKEKEESAPSPESPESPESAPSAPSPAEAVEAEAVEAEEAKADEVEAEEAK